MTTSNETPSTKEMTVETIGRDLLQALVTEIKLLPDVWQKLSETKQNDVIDRLRNRVAHNVVTAVHMIASDGRTVVQGDLDQITIKDGVKAVVKFSSAAPNLHELYEASGKAVLVVVASADDHLDGIDEVKGESDQRAMDLGHEYDPNSDGKGMDDSDVVVDALVKAIGDDPLTEDLQRAWDDGYAAAEAGKTMNDCPVMDHRLVAQWTNGFRTWKEEHPSDGDASSSSDASS